MNKIDKAAPSADVLIKLRSFLDAEEPKLVYFLVNIQKAQGRAITYKELREAILNGDISNETLEEWFQDYSEFVREHLQPTWENAIMAAAGEYEKKYPLFHFNPMAEGINEWTMNRGAEFVTNITYNQMMGVRAVIREAAVLEWSNVDLLARAIRPMVGLYYQQSVANMKYFTKLVNGGMNEKRALDLSIRYGARQHRYRAYLISRTELAFAYNKGAHEAVLQAQERGYMGDTVKVWSTAFDERVCKICGGLEGKTVGMNEEFDFPTKLAVKNPAIRLTPPAHPSCRCAVMYKEITPPIYQTEPEA